MYVRIIYRYRYNNQWNETIVFASVEDFRFCVHHTHFDAI